MMAFDIARGSGGRRTHYIVRSCHYSVRRKYVGGKHVVNIQTKRHSSLSLLSIITAALALALSLCFISHSPDAVRHYAGGGR